MNKPKRILVLTSKIYDFSKSQLKRIEEISPGSIIDVIDSNKNYENSLKNAEIIFGLPDCGKLIDAKKLKWLHLSRAGVNKYLNRNFYANEDIIITNGSGTFGQSIAEHVLALMLSFNSNIHIHFRESQWLRLFKTRNLCGSTVGILGMGDIGTEVAKRCKALGTKVIAVKRDPSGKPEYIDKLDGKGKIDELLAQSDYVVLALPETEETKGIISAQSISLMKKNAFIINVGRGSAIDQEALIQALKEKRIAGAGLDVTVPEPLPADNQLWKMDNVIITSHTSAISPGLTEKSINIFIENLKRYIYGEKLLNIVDFDKGY